MSFTTNSNARVLSEDLVDNLITSSVLPEFNIPQEEQLNFIAIFTAENGAELELEFHCSDSAKARDHVDGLIYFFKKDLHFLWMSGERWSEKPDVLKRVFIKRKKELAFVEFEIERPHKPYSESLTIANSAVLV